MSKSDSCDQLEVETCGFSALHLEMGWTKRSKCRQVLNCTYVFVFLQRPRLRGEEEGAGRECSRQAARGRGGARPSPHSPMQGVGQPHASGTFVGTGTGQELGLWGAGNSHSYSLSLSMLSGPGQWKPCRSSYFPISVLTQGYLWGPLSPGGALPPGWDVWPPGVLWGDSSNTAPGLLAYHTVQNHLFQCGKGDEMQPSGFSGSPPGLGTGQPKQMAEQAASQGQEMAKCLPAPCLPSLFWDLGTRCHCPALRLSTVVSLGSGQCLRAGLSPQKTTQACLRTSRFSSPWDTGASQVPPTHWSMGSTQNILPERHQVVKQTSYKIFLPSVFRWKQTSFTSLNGAEGTKPSQKSCRFKACRHHGNGEVWGDINAGQ